MSASSVLQWVESGKQVAVSLSYEVGGETYWTSVGMQEWNGVLLVYVDEIREANMSAEVFEREEMLAFETVDAAADFVDSKTQANFDDLRPCRGQKVFNPALYSPPCGASSTPPRS